MKSTKTLSPQVHKILVLAKDLAFENKHDIVVLDHLLAAVLITEKQYLSNLLSTEIYNRLCYLNSTAVAQESPSNDPVNKDDIELSQASFDIFALCSAICKHSKHDEISNTMLILALISFILQNDIYPELQKPLDTVKSIITAELDIDEDLEFYIKNTDREEVGHLFVNVNLTMIEQGKSLDFHKDHAQLDRLYQILLKVEQNNPILYGESGIGKTSLVYSLVHEIVNCNAPRTINKMVVYQLHLHKLISHCQFSDILNEKISYIFNELEPNAIVFIDNFEDVFNETANILGRLKDHLETGKRIIGCMSDKKMINAFKQDSVLNRTTSIYKVKPPTVKQTIDILNMQKHVFTQHYKYRYTKDVLGYAAETCVKYLDGNLPYAAMSILDDASSLKKLYNNNDKKVTTEDINRAIQQKAKVPIFNKHSKDKFKGVQAKFKEKIIGQDKAIDAISDSIKSQILRINSHKPLGSFLFLGTTGVGKTFLAKTLAEVLFNDKNNMIYVDMSEMMDSHSINRLIGAPPGYIGYDSNDTLVDKVKRKPYSVILFDEVEKAHRDVMDIFLQILEEGRLTSGDGKTCSFKNCFIIFTSNIGSSKLEKTQLGFGPIEDQSMWNEQQVKDELKRYLSPELINRFDHIITFNKLTDKDLHKISNLILDDLCQEIFSHAEVTVTYDSKVSKCIIDNMDPNDQQYGARAIKRYINNNVHKIICQHYIDNDVDNIKVSVKNGKLVCL